MFEKIKERRRKKKEIDDLLLDLEIKRLNVAMHSTVNEDVEADFKALKTIEDIKHSKRDDKKNVLVAVCSGAGGAASVLLTLKVINIGKRHDEQGIIETSSVSKPMTRSVLGNVFKR